MCYDFFGRKVSNNLIFFLIWFRNQIFLHTVLYFLYNDKSSTERPSILEPAVINISNRKQYKNKLNIYVKVLLNSSEAK